MATTRTARTAWEGNLARGSGRVTMASSGIGEFPVSWPARAEAPDGLTEAGTPPTRLDTQADVTFQPGTGITGIHLTVTGEVPGLDEATFVGAAEAAKAGCPVSQALAGTTITLTASLA